MKITRKALLITLFIAFNTSLPAQTCNCNISQVESNTVAPCKLLIGNVSTVSTTAELRNAIILANSEGGNRTILIADGTYQIASTAWYPYITASNMVFRSLSGNRDAVILTGHGMVDVAPAVEIGMFVVGDNVTIADLTIRGVGNHGISVSGDNLFVHNVKIQNTFEQMIKGTTSSSEGPADAIVQCSLFEYPAGIGPQYYIGGLDIHKGTNWIVRDNIFKNIASPSAAIAEHAIHFWDFTANNTIERNVIINCDRGIGFGLGSSPNDGGIIRNNMIYNNGAGIFNDVGIGLETSPNTKVYNNTIYIAYPNAIEYRFAASNNVNIVNNLTNKSIKSRDGGQATLSTNHVNAAASWFENISTGNLRLTSEIPTVTNHGTSLPDDVAVDIDQTIRPQGSAYDIGAYENLSPMDLDDINSSAQSIIAFPNPAATFFTIKAAIRTECTITIYNILNQITTAYEGKDLSSGFRIEVKEWENGLYFCQISDSKHNSKTIKLVVSK